MDGLKIFAYVTSSTECAAKLENFFTDWLNVYDSYQQDNLLTSILSMTDAFGELSYVLRTCYNVGGSLQDNWEYYSSIWDDGMSIFNMFKNNIASSYLDIDDRSWSSYNTLNNQDW